MKEGPILYSGSMVRAILADRKTKTRRIAKITPDQYENIEDFYAENLPPKGVVGDRLWVKESFWGCRMPGYEDQPCVVYDDEWIGKEYLPSEVRPYARKFGRIPSIHMPRNCSRITQEITDYRIEKLNDISDDDALEEGIYKKDGDGFGYKFDHGEQEYDTPVEAYRSLWQFINGAGSWDKNPWV